MLWASLPLMVGLPEVETPPSATASAKKMEEKPAAKVDTTKVEAVAVEKKEAPVKAASGKAVKKAVPVVEPEPVAPKAEPDSEMVENVDELLAAVEAMRAKRPGLRARKAPPSVEEMDRRRLQLRETVGRILASL